MIILEGNIPPIAKSFAFDIDGFVSYYMTVTILFTVIFVVNAGVSYQIENVEASVSQSTNISSVFEFTDKGNSLYYLGKYEEAIVWSDKALAIDPKDIDVLYTKGLALENLGKKEDALIWIDKALALDPTDQQLLDAKSRLQQ